MSPIVSAMLQIVTKLFETKLRYFCLLKYKRLVMIDYTELYKTYQPKLNKMFSNQIKDKDYVEDLTQETLLKVHKYLDKGGEVRYSLSTFIYSVAFNTLKNYYRSQSHLPQLFFSAELSDNPWTVSFDSPENMAIAEETNQKYAKALEGMQPQWIEAYTLKETDGLTLKQIAIQLDIPEGTAKSRYYRAKEFVTSKVKEV